MKFSCSYVSIVILDNKHYGTEVSIKNYFHSDLTYNTYRYEDHEQELVYPLLAEASRPPSTECLLACCGFDLRAYFIPVCRFIESCTQ